MTCATPSLPTSLILSYRGRLSGGLFPFPGTLCAERAIRAAPERRGRDASACLTRRGAGKRVIRENRCGHGSARHSKMETDILQVQEVPR